ncbi:hypothetical protein Ade02nite_37790 [Paractinoplanes deccanensis]|uniref:Integral membrane protein n=1 Tax=Paractinoplanes deccanensis TaxID=113561 RepID=A0ABQ3Y575_9ACTN|nr:hypothetical protein [Actinoplanes deccanensis]GID75138.1 hypothetical protein Ade02nite_37790 [Actinoplanes deccanensis]
MTPAVAVLLLLAGLSEAVGRLLPVVARRSGASRHAAAGLVLFGAVVDAAVFALWPLTAWTVAELVLPDTTPQLSWTPGLLAPLLLAAVLAFPLLGPFLHLLLLAAAGAGLADALAASTGTGWWAAAGCVAVAGAGLGLAVEAVRRLVALLTKIREPELET